MHQCDRCERLVADGSPGSGVLDEMFLCNDCLTVMLIWAQDEESDSSLIDREGKPR